jgi:hypothetical protein
MTTLSRQLKKTMDEIVKINKLTFQVTGNEKIFLPDADLYKGYEITFTNVDLPRVPSNVCSLENEGISIYEKEYDTYEGGECLVPPSGVTKTTQLFGGKSFTTRSVPRPQELIDGERAYLDRRGKFDVRAREWCWTY